jgi:hypothetical protein
MGERNAPSAFSVAVHLWPNALSVRPGPSPRCSVTQLAPEILLRTIRRSSRHPSPSRAINGPYGQRLWHQRQRVLIRGWGIPWRGSSGQRDRRFSRRRSKRCSEWIAAARRGRRIGISYIATTNSTHIPPPTPALCRGFFYCAQCPGGMINSLAATTQSRAPSTARAMPGLILLTFMVAQKCNFGISLITKCRSVSSQPSGMSL